MTEVASISSACKRQREHKHDFGVNYKCDSLVQSACAWRMAAEARCVDIGAYRDTVERDAREPECSCPVRAWVVFPVCIGRSVTEPSPNGQNTSALWSNTTIRFENKIIIRTCAEPQEPKQNSCSSQVRPGISTFSQHMARLRYRDSRRESRSFD